MRLEGCNAVVEVRDARTGRVLKTKRCRNVGVELMMAEEDDTVLVSVHCKPPIVVRLGSAGFKVHQRFVQQGKVSLSASTKQRTSAVMVQCCDDTAAVCEFARAAVRVCNGLDAVAAAAAAAPTGADTSTSAKASARTSGQGQRSGGAHIQRKRVLSTLSPHSQKQSPPSKLSADLQSRGVKKLPQRKVPSQAVSTLSAEQRRVLEAVVGGQSVFFTGGAGSGKSHLLGVIRQALPSGPSTAMTASTGAAACLIGGSTVHHFAGVGSGEGPLNSLVRMASRPANRARWRAAQTLVIDEVSMLDAEFFSKLEAVARAVRIHLPPAALGARAWQLSPCSVSALRVMDDTLVVSARTHRP
jgi:ATP-dependent DNA helicase PIF1